MTNNTYLCMLTIFHQKKNVGKDCFVPCSFFSGWGWGCVPGELMDQQVESQHALVHATRLNKLPVYKE